MADARASNMRSNQTLTNKLCLLSLSVLAVIAEGRRIRRIKGFFHLAPLLRAIIETKKGDIIVFYGFSNGL
jgi:hypothetical protein